MQIQLFLLELFEDLKKEIICSLVVFPETNEMTFHSIGHRR